MKRRRLTLPSLLLLALLIGFPARSEEAPSSVLPPAKRAQLNLALCRAVQFLDAASVKRWLEAGADPNASFTLPATPANSRQGRPAQAGYHMPVLIFALEWERRLHSFPISRLLLEHGADANAREQDGQTALMLVTSYSHVADAPRGHAEAADVHGMPNGHSLNKRLDSPVMPFDTPFWPGEFINSFPSPLHWQMVKLLLEKGARVNAQDKQGRTALMYALAGPEDRDDVVRALLAKGAHVNMRDAQGRTALMLAKLRYNPSLISLLIEAGAKE